MIKPMGSNNHHIKPAMPSYQKPIFHVKKNVKMFFGDLTIHSQKNTQIM